MRKKWLLFLMFFMLFPGVVSAHTDLENAIPRENETVTVPVTDVILDFENPIGSMSTLIVRDEKGIAVPLLSVVVDQKRMFGTLKNPLPNGTYQVDWRIAGLDGHVISRSYLFQIKLPSDTLKKEGSPSISTIPGSLTDNPLSSIETSSQTMIQPDQESMNTSRYSIFIFKVIVIIFTILLIIFVIFRIVRRHHYHSGSE